MKSYEYLDHRDKRSTVFTNDVHFNVWFMRDHYKELSLTTVKTHGLVRPSELAPLIGKRVRRGLAHIWSQ